MFVLNPVEWFVNIPPEWAIFWTSMIPITELRASIPLGIEVYGLAIWKVWIIAVIGDMVPALVILALIPHIHKWVIRRRFFGSILTKKLQEVDRKFSGPYFKYGAMALIIFVGIPLPFTGSWTGSLASFVFNIKFKRAVPLIFIGVCVAATLVTLITLFAGGTLRAIF
ncbi:small multi-drug export protein [Patescibacteria group bacterium]|nr:small multi-drug export protein [Patescibacteria group bacterium]